ncbi:ABC transporter ATP-binding protein [Methylobacterium sp. J-072]|uniref:ABC transporter ATP-binding protein n=1 Tax=Methylobacterium sp. J-072 TaxID=2836651 RepID=UPI001FBC0430|nr:ABC transporter ATP-binding protein [Methylobacterium sp. J-072]MCJ2094512.1 ABC transporter ATP-binding protein [Methylobacterium sp. J-072]
MTVHILPPDLQATRLPPLPDPLIVVEDVAKRFVDGRTGRVTAALEHLSFAIRDGEFVCLLGPSGCGKSSVLDLLCGFEQPTEGRIVVEGGPVREPGPDRGIVFQEALLFPWLSVFDNITFAPRLAGVPAALYRPRAARLIALMGLDGFENHAPYELSGGMRQRAAIARAWISEPRILLMDEPFGALDAQTRLSMQEQLLIAREATGATVLFVTHDIEEALFLADRILVLSARPGRVAREIPVPFGRSRRYAALLTDERFGRLKREIVEELRAG